MSKAKVAKQMRNVTDYLIGCLVSEVPTKVSKNLPDGMMNGSPIPVVGPVPVAFLRGRGFRFVRTARVKAYNIPPLENYEDSCLEPQFYVISGSHGFDTFVERKFYVSQGATICILGDKKGRFGVGTAFCSVSDSFNETAGKNKSLLRARQAMTLARERNKKKSRPWKLLNNMPFMRGGR